MVERRLPKPKVAGSNPVFRSHKNTHNHRPQHTRRRSFLFRLPHPSGKRGSAKTFSSLLWRAGVDIKRRGNTRADFEYEDEKSVRVRTPFSAHTKTYRTTDRSTPAGGLFYTTPRTRAGNRVQPRPSPPSFGGPGWILKGAGTLALISSPKTRNQCEFEPRFPLTQKHTEPQTAAHPPAVFFYHIA